MRILKNIKFDSVCKKASVVMGALIAVLILCGVFRDNPAAPVIGDISACAVISMYAGTFVYAVCNALAEEAGSYGEYVLRSGHTVCASCAAAQAVKLFFLLLPCPGAELIGGVVIIADAAVSWILPMMVVKDRRAVFLAKYNDKTVSPDLPFDKKIFGRY